MANTPYTNFSAMAFSDGTSSTIILDLVEGPVTYPSDVLVNAREAIGVSSVLVNGQPPASVVLSKGVLTLQVATIVIAGGGYSISGNLLF